MTTTVRPTRRLAAADRRRQILEVTRDLVAEQGFHGLSMEAVSQRAGVSRPIVYEHFGDLAGLLEALVDELGGRALLQLAAVLPSADSTGDPADLLLRALRGYLEAARADPATWRLILTPPEGAPAILRERIAQGRAAVVAQLAGALGVGVGTREPSPDPELTARMMSTFADEAARLMLALPEEYPVERLLRHARWLLRQLEPGVD